VSGRVVSLAELARGVGRQAGYVGPSISAPDSFGSVAQGQVQANPARLKRLLCGWAVCAVLCCSVLSLAHRHGHACARGDGE
jgi:hypothetical protein